MKQNSSPIIISIEANIGAGKSTVLQKLQNILDPTTTKCILEPIHYWDTFYDQQTNRSLLELYYNNPTKYALPLQTMIYSSLSAILQEAVQEMDFLPYNNQNKMIITERSLQTSCSIFTKMLYNSNIMTQVEYQVYTNCIANNPAKLDVCIYLRSEPEVCYERIRDRNRDGEHKITLEYLRTCHEAHETWINSLYDTKLYIIEMKTKTPDKIMAEILDILQNL